MLKQRIITAIVLLFLFFAVVLFLPSDGLIAVFAVVVMVASWEWCKLAGLYLGESLVFYATLLLAMATLYQYAEPLQAQHWLPLVALLWWSGIAVVMFRYPRVIVAGDNGRLMRLSKAMMGVVVLLSAWWSLGLLHADNRFGVTYFLYCFLLVWWADTGAYLFGKRFGRHKLAPHISPGKTIEGLCGGIMCVFVLSVLVGGWLGFELSRYIGFVLLSVIVAVYSVVGDLFESVLKRQRGFKDSSQLLPGHGGVLDRIDSMLAAAPVFWFGLQQLG